MALTWVLPMVPCRPDAPKTLCRLTWAPGEASWLWGLWMFAKLILPSGSRPTERAAYARFEVSAVGRSAAKIRPLCAMGEPEMLELFDPPQVNSTPSLGSTLFLAQ